MPAQTPKAAGLLLLTRCLGQCSAAAARSLWPQSPLSCEQQHLVQCKQIPVVLKWRWDLSACFLALFGRAGRWAGTKAVPGRQQKECEHLVKLVCRQDQPSALLPVSSHLAETAEHVPAPSRGEGEHDALLKPAFANAVCRLFQA